MKQLKLSGFGILILLMTGSCNNYLTVDPDNRRVTAGYFNSNQRMEQGIIGAYVDLRRALIANYAWLMYGEARTGDLVVAVDYNNLVAQQALTSGHPRLKALSDWTYFYDVIKSANDVLEALQSRESESLTPYQKNLFKGEALALKSLTYFYLLRIWGEIPSAEPGNMGRLLSGQETASLAINFAQEATGLLPWMLTNNDGIESAALTSVRFNKTVAHILLAQLELWAGNSQGALNALAPLLSDDPERKLSAFGISLGVDRRVSISQTPLGAHICTMKTDRFNQLYPEGDLRRTSIFYISSGVISVYMRDATQLPLLKLDEINLLMAEALWHQGLLEDAKDRLIRASKGATEDYSSLDESEFGDALLLERQRLLIGTGQRFFDLVRFQKVSDHVTALTAEDVAAGAAYWPVFPDKLKENNWSRQSYWFR